MERKKNEPLYLPQPEVARVGEMQIDDQEAGSGGESPAGSVDDLWSPALIYSKIAKSQYKTHGGCPAAA